jgi:arylformamidase
MKQLAISLVLCLAVSVWAAGAAGANANAATTTCATPREKRDIPYVADPVSDLQRLDIYGFETSKRCDEVPVVIYVHGGGWIKGDKSRLGDKAAFFNDLGYVFVSMNYRLSDPPRDPDHPIHPAHAQDVGAAVTWVEKHIAEFGGNGKRIALLGHSAGAHLVVLVGVDDQYIDQAGGHPSVLRCVMSDDTEAYDVVARAAGSPGARFVITTAFGPDEDVWRDASPLTHVGDGTPPPFLVVRRGDATRRAGQTAFADALEAAGGKVTVLDAPG